MSGLRPSSRVSAGGGRIPHDSLVASRPRSSRRALGGSIMCRALSLAGLLALVAASSVGCVAPRLASCPAEGGRPWRELESRFFTLQTDLSSEEAREAMD